MKITAEPIVGIVGVILTLPPLLLALWQMGKWGRQERLPLFRAESRSPASVPECKVGLEIAMHNGL